MRRSIVASPEALLPFTRLQSGWYRLQAVSRAACPDAPTGQRWWDRWHARPLTLLGAQCGGRRSCAGWPQLVESSANARWKVYLARDGRWRLSTVPSQSCGDNAALAVVPRACGALPRLFPPRSATTPAAPDNEWALHPVPGTPPGTYNLVASAPNGCTRRLLGVAPSAGCRSAHLRMYDRDDGSGMQRWALQPVKVSGHGQGAHEAGVLRVQSCRVMRVPDAGGRCCCCGRCRCCCRQRSRCPAPHCARS